MFVFVWVLSRFFIFVPAQIDKLSDYLNDPVKSLWLVKDLPLKIRSRLLEGRRYLAFLAREVDRLASMGLAIYTPHPNEGKEMVSCRPKITRRSQRPWPLLPWSWPCGCPFKSFYFFLKIFMWKCLALSKTKFPTWFRSFTYYRLYKSCVYWKREKTNFLARAGFCQARAVSTKLSTQKLAVFLFSTVGL